MIYKLINPPNRFSLLIWGLGLLLMTSCRKDLAPNTPVFEFCPGSPTVTDVDGNTYNTVLLGDRCWTRSNLKVSKYRNGDALGSDPSLGYWSSVNQGSFTLYNNQAANKNEYGYLYNAYAALDARGLCPLGWHVPTDAEWYLMVKSLDPTANANVIGAESATAGGPLKSTDLWNSPNTGGNNASGFGAVPGGFRSESGVYGAQLDGGTYWSSSLDGSAKTWFRYLYDDNASVVRNSGNMRQGRSIRCIRDLTGTGGGGGGSDTLQAPSITTLTISGIAVNQANSGGTISSDGGSPVLQRGVAYGQNPLPDLSQSYTMDGSGSGSFSSQLTNLAANTLYYARAYATNAVGTSFGQALSFTTSTLPPPPACQANACPSTPTITDYDGQVYGTVQIGNQCWMASNLRAVSYRNGDAILPWSNQSNVGYQAVYDDSAANAPIYGRLYNSYAVLDSRGLCPTGWHIPSSAEFDVLAKFVDASADSGSLIFNGPVSATAGGALKSTLLWSSPNVGATNSTCFGAIAAGYRGNAGISYYNQGIGGYFWTSTQAFPGLFGSLLDRRLWNFTSELVVAPNAPDLGFSVRCLRDSAGN